MDPDRQSTTVDRTPEGQIRIVYECLSNGIKFGGDFVFEHEAVDWLTDHLLKAADDNLPGTAENVTPPDHFRVYIGGGHRYDDINVNVSNERDPSAPHGRLYVLTAMTPEIARNLVEQIRQA